jgi:RNA polymerase sigma factor (sigma-70 family)
MYLASETLKPPPGERSGTEAAMAEFEAVYAFIYSRVGNRADAEDLTQEVALKAMPRLRADAPPPAVRGYLYATARSVLATFWSGRLRLPESELPESFWVRTEPDQSPPRTDTAAWVTTILEALAPGQRRVLELRFLRGYSLREVADEMGTSVGSVKVTQFRALRRAAAIAGREALPARSAN